MYFKRIFKNLFAAEASIKLKLLPNCADGLWESASATMLKNKQCVIWKILFSRFLNALNNIPLGLPIIKISFLNCKHLSAVRYVFFFISVTTNSVKLLPQITGVYNIPQKMIRSKLDNLVSAVRYEIGFKYL